MSFVIVISVLLVSLVLITKSPEYAAQSTLAR
jgi:hypothetical protein